MIVEVVLCNRNTHIVRKLRKEFGKHDMRNILELLQKIKEDEAIIQIFIDAESYF